jgi:CheY-like chemotaxis protein
MKKILIIEDDQFFIQTLSQMFDPKDFQIISASDGEEGISKIKSELPDLVLLDFIMPKVNGDEVLEQVKSDSMIKDIPIIVLTGLAVDKADLIDKGAEKCYIKVDLDPVQFVEEIKQRLHVVSEKPTTPH